jgi:hypothetical protein
LYTREVSRTTVTGQANYDWDPRVQKVTITNTNVSTRVGLGRVQQQRAWFAQAGSQNQTLIPEP